MIWITFIILILYCFFTIWLSKGLRKNKEKFSTILTGKVNEPSDLFLSVIVPFRNEEKRISYLLRSIKNQSLANFKFEIILVDDQSNDGSRKIIEEFIGFNSKINTKLARIPIGIGGGKKKAIEIGVSQSKGNFIIQTDADCTADSEWLIGIYNFINIINPDLLILPVFIEPSSNILSKFDSMEYASLQVVGIGMASQNSPILCSASNLAFRKSFYENTKAKRTDENLSSGDDIFLLQAAIRDKSKIDYCINSSICVSTPSLNSLENIIAQRKRWVSKNSSIQDLVYQIVAAFGFLTNLILIYILLFKSEFFLLLFVLKLIADYFLLKTFYTLINKPFQTIPFVLNSFLYPFYLIYIVFTAFSTKNSWRGRIVKN